MVDVSRWLAEQGLGHHAEVFANNGIAGDVLRDLTDTDLKELGLNLGDRKRLLKSIAALDAGPTQDPAGAVELAATPAAPREAERRQLTVLFCDLVGSTELSARLDPEDLREVIGAYHAACARVIARFDGHVARFLGDGVLAYFGWPRAHEDDAERAVRAGLAMVESIDGLAVGAEVPLAARIGIATGRVVVGDLETVDAFRQRRRRWRDTKSRRPATGAGRAAVGRDQPSDATADRQSVRARQSRSQAPEGFRRAARGLAGLGRESERRTLRGETDRRTHALGRPREEIALLLRRWRQARDSEGQVVLLSGEPGIGKSRLVRELRARFGDEPHLRLTYQCSPYHQSSPLHPVIEQLERAGGFERDDSPELKLAKLEALLARGTDKLDDAVPLFAALLGISTEERYPAFELTPQRQKQLTLEALLDQLEGLAAEQPVLAVHEDVHWIDPTTQELLGLAIERLSRLPVLLLITFRPEFSPPWSGQPHVSSLALTRLGRRDGALMVGRLVGAKALPADVSEQIVAKTDGVPLFVEELTKTVLESGLLTDAGDHYELGGPLPPLAIPATLHDSLMARLDRLAPVKEIAQLGAVIGPEFSQELLAAVADRPEDQLCSALDQLVAAELIFRRGAPPNAVYSFKHALVQTLPTSHCSDPGVSSSMPASPGRSRGGFRRRLPHGPKCSPSTIRRRVCTIRRWTTGTRPGNGRASAQPIWRRSLI